MRFVAPETILFASLRYANAMLAEPSPGSVCGEEPFDTRKVEGPGLVR